MTDSIGKVRDYLAEHQAWLVVERELAKRASELVQMHFSRAGLAVTDLLTPVASWADFAMRFRWDIRREIDEGKRDAWVRQVLDAVTLLSLEKPEFDGEYLGAPESLLADVVGALITHCAYPFRERVLALLPPEAGPAVRLVEVREEEELRRMNESGY